MIWIWIGIGWLAFWLLSIVLIVNYNIYNKDRWCEDIVIILPCFAIAPIAWVAIAMGTGFDCFKFRKRSKKMKKVYWNEAQGQIKTKDGKCLYDVNRHQGTRTEFRQAYTTIQDRLNATRTDGPLLDASKFVKLQAQLQCSAKTNGKHKMVFKKKNINDVQKGGTIQNPNISWQVTYCLVGTGYIFKCSICGLEITKTEKELTSTEKEALKKLKLI